jgi:hypothetical protein
MMMRMNDRVAPGWVYVMTHPAWDKIGMVKIGKTGRDPRTRAGEITTVSGLLAPCTIACCVPVSDMAAAEIAVHRMLGGHRVRKRRELFRVDAAAARRVVEAVAGSLPSSRSSRAFMARLIPVLRSAGGWNGRSRRQSSFRRRGRRRVGTLVRLVAGMVAIGALAVLVQPLLHP